VRRGIPDSAILLETQGRTTIESLQAVSRLMDDRPSRRVILVSDPFHMLRLSIVAQRLGMTPYTSPTRTSPISRNLGEQWKYVLSESMKVPVALIMESKGQ
jgi:uncharacterized SAM-binding protein YcdF (DUF218 family)